MIESVEVNGYRLLDQFEAELGNLTVVIGANAVGKSTLMDFLKFISQCAEFPLENVLSWHMGWPSILSAHSGADRSVSWKLNFRRPRRGSIWASASLDADQLYTYEVVLKADPTGLVRPQYEVLRTSEPYADYDKPFKYLEMTPYRSSLFDKRLRKLIPFDDALPDEDKPVKQGESEAPDIQNPSTATALRLSQMRFLQEYPLPSTCRILLALMAFYPGFDVGRNSALRSTPADIKPETTLSQLGENLGTVLHEILTRFDYKGQADEIRAFMKAAYPFFEDVTTETTYGGTARVLVRVRERGMQRSMELWELSDGMLRFLCLSAAFLAPDLPPFMAIDEPEAGLHPRLLPIVADMIKTASERTQVLVTTHSPELLNHFGIDSVAVLTRDGGFAKWHRPSSRESLVRLLSEVSGERIGDLHISGELEEQG